VTHDNKVRRVSGNRVWAPLPLPRGHPTSELSISRPRMLLPATRGSASPTALGAASTPGAVTAWASDIAVVVENRMYCTET
jgi:hypothetical protein